jgi:hypothetical protein
LLWSQETEKADHTLVRGDVIALSTFADYKNYWNQHFFGVQLFQSNGFPEIEAVLY